MNPVERKIELQGAVPLQRSQRDRLLRAARRYVRARRPTPPLSLEQLERHARAVLEECDADAGHLPYAVVLLNNEVWRDLLAAVPFQRRLLLLPMCLRDADACQATIDDYGLLCRHCGGCVLHELLTEAQRLGYVTLVAEGTAVVTSLIQSGKIEAVIGASCLSSLEQIFQFIAEAAFPGIAIPLLRDGCRNTAMDVDWLVDAIYLRQANPAARLDMAGLRAEVNSWFTPAALAETLGTPGGQTERIAQEYLAAGGKRWRPFLTACAYQALRGDGGACLAAELRFAATAVECFHKASLIHDDIEDGDALRDGRRTLHERYGVPVALNLGDFLIGEGYRLIAESSAPAEARAEMLAAAARAHRRLCLGQGAELAWMRRRAVLSPPEVLSIYTHKTSPAFEVALRLGAILAGADRQLGGKIEEYCGALGAAYQIRDDLEDFGPGGDAMAGRPSVLLALAAEAARGDDVQAVAELWKGTPAAQAAALLERLGAREQAQALLDRYKRQAADCLEDLDVAPLKVLLRRLVAKIFDEPPQGNSD